MYEKYHEAADALRQERWGRKHAESILERVIFFNQTSILLNYNETAKLTLQNYLLLIHNHTCGPRISCACLGEHVGQNLQGLARLDRIG